MSGPRRVYSTGPDGGAPEPRDETREPQRAVPELRFDTAPEFVQPGPAEELRLSAGPPPKEEIGEFTPAERLAALEARVAELPRLVASTPPAIPGDAQARAASATGPRSRSSEPEPEPEPVRASPQLSSPAFRSSC